MEKRDLDLAGRVRWGGRGIFVGYRETFRARRGRYGGGDWGLDRRVRTRRWAPRPARARRARARLKPIPRGRSGDRVGESRPLAGGTPGPESP